MYLWLDSPGEDFHPTYLKKYQRESFRKRFYGQIKLEASQMNISAKS